MRYPPYSAVQGLPWQNPSVVFSDGDMAKARAILDEAGWKKKQCGRA
ncbi:Nickel ABC transporter, periplasmic nickel-binding protein nikA2 [Salmonella enterica subsp. arizonae]|uniref:Nickel ABC transporter, periplasmic nickel-binding protein nikA2, partial n=1 Tax=Salmonella enterica subsp. arizonae TaxID=59203 RepID=A0A379SVZ9_SALER|nr:Nickel ABC transporter, periplasmic nickel-binding protein nikA2 [Salmonella enterica subsp. arizonae]